MKKLKSKAKNGRLNDKASNMLKWIILTSVANMFLMLLICLVVYITDAEANSSYLIILAVECIGLFITSYFTGRKFRKNGMLKGILCNGPYIIIVLISSLLLSDFSADTRIATSLIFMLSTSAIGGIVSVNTHKKR